MSKNFELLLEIEKDFGSVPPEPHRISEPTAIPVPTLSAVDVSDVDEEMLRLVKRVFFPATGAAHRHVVFCGIEAANPSSSVCARAARTLAARTLERVCIVDANPSPSGLMSLFSIAAAVGDERAETGRCVALTSNLWLAGHSTSNNGVNRASNLQARVAELQRDFGFVLIDAPPLGLGDEATMLGQISDAAILVIEAETTRRVAASKAKQELESAGVRLAGTVLNNRSFPIPKALYQRL